MISSGYRSPLFYRGIYAVPCTRSIDRSVRRSPEAVTRVKAHNSPDVDGKKANFLAEFLPAISGIRHFVSSCPVHRSFISQHAVKDNAPRILPSPLMSTPTGASAVISPEEPPFVRGRESFSLNFSISGREGRAKKNARIQETEEKRLPRNERPQ